MFRHYKNHQLINFFKIKPLVIYARSCVVFKNVNKAYVHKGNMFVTFFKTRFNVYNKFGVFSFTRRPFVYKIKKKV